MAMTLADIRDFTRLSLDLDSEDLPDSLIDLYSREGFTKLIRDQARWPFYEKQWTLGLVADTADYAYTAVGADLEEPVAIWGDDGLLVFRDQHELEHAFPANNTSSAARPYEWTTRRDIITLWPTPSDSATILTVDGYRQPTALVGAGSEPDCPDDMHECIAFWALGRAYQQQDELDQSQMYFQTFAEQKMLLERRYIGHVAPRPVVLNRNNTRRMGNVPRPLRYGFDGR